MIYDEALREAEYRWGEKGYVRDQATEFNRFRVGWQDGGGNVINAPQFLFRQGV